MPFYTGMNTTTDPITAAELPTAESSADQFGINVGEQIESRMQSQAQEPQRFEETTPSSRCNVGRTEQKYRLAAGTALLATAAFAPLSRGWRIGLAALGVAELITGSTRYCPVSQLLGINTCQRDER